MRTNTPVRRENLTHEGARSFPMRPLAELERLAMTALLWEPNFYTTGDQTATRMAELAAQVSPQQLADLTVRSRTRMHLRHTPLFLARELARRPEPEARALVPEVLNQIILRADEPAEFLAMYMREGRQPLSHSVRRGLSQALRRFDAYALAKYDRAGAFRLRDVLRLVRPKPEGEAQAELWRQAVKGDLPTPATWETRLSSGEDKRVVFTEMLQNRQLGGLALLRNLRGMQEAGVSRELIRESLASHRFSRVLPYRFIAAARHNPGLEGALEVPMLRAARALPRLPGLTRLYIDVSGSMGAQLSTRSDLSRIDAASALAILLREMCDDVEIHTFENTVQQVPDRRGFALRDAIGRPRGGTMLGAAVKQANAQGYDRLIVITDEQSRDKVDGPLAGKPAYMVNVASHSQAVGFGPWVRVSGFSEEITRFISTLEGVDEPDEQSEQALEA